MPRPTTALGGVVLVVGALLLGVLALSTTDVRARRTTVAADGPRPATTTTQPAAPAVEASAATTDGPAGVEQYRQKGWIARENAKPGSPDWHIPDDKAMWAKISGFADTTSVDIGGTFTLRVSTAAPTWRVSAYRIGYYGGNGGRLVWRSPDQPGVVQPGPTTDPRTGLHEAPWAPSLKVTTDVDWPPGQYLLRLESSDGGADFVPMVIRDDGSTSDLLVQSSVTTWQAYNGWGGASLYTGTRGRADVVSFDRPYTGNGSGEFLGREFEFIWMAERLGLDVSYWTDIDLAQRGRLALHHRAVVIPGHDEYYTVGMRRSLEAARDAGVNLAFFGADNVYRRIRLEASPLGADRHEVNYRTVKGDPVAEKDPAAATTSWREAPDADPESSLVGNYYECNPVEAGWVVADASAWMFEGSGFHDGDVVPKMVGNEYDRVTPGVPTPADIQVIAHSPVNCKGLRSYSDSTWYSAPSGAGVFSAGTLSWEPLLDDPCPQGVDTSSACRVQKVTENILRAMAAGPAGAAHPSSSNLARLGIPRPPDTTSTTSTTGPPARSATTGSTSAAD